MSQPSAGNLIQGVTDSEMEQRLTLREALAEDRLAEFVRQEEGRGVELANGSELERALALLITKRRVHVGPLLASSAVEWPFFCPPPPCRRVSSFLPVTGFCAIYSKSSEGFVHS
jgi:hypothetical protein